jgi:hypothetical protein
VVVSHQLTVRGDSAALAAVSDVRFDGRRVVVTERSVPGVPQVGSGARGSAGTARLVTYAPQRVTISATATAPSMLVLSDLFYPGWKATVDGRSVSTERVDYLLRGVPLSPGVHRVEFRYEPASWRAGWIISVVTLVGLVVALALQLRRTRRRPARPERN